MHGWGELIGQTKTKKKTKKISRFYHVVRNISQQYINLHCEIIYKITSS